MGFNPRDVARAGRKVYERHRADFERLHPGKYVLIDIRTEKLYLAESPEGAYRQAAAEDDAGPFHLVRVGERAAFRSRRLPHGVDTQVTR
jgi:rhodanese-related sulfurtransferase